MASNAVLSEQRTPQPVAVARAQLAINEATRSRVRVATESDSRSSERDLGLRAGLKVDFEPHRSDDLPDGVVSVVDAIKAMEQLPRNWDSYGGLPLADESVRPAMELIIEGIRRCRIPTVVLRPNGGLGIRWASDGRSLEVDVNPDGACTAFFEDAAGEEVEIDSPTAVTGIVPLVHQFCHIG